MSVAEGPESQTFWRQRSTDSLHDRLQNIFTVQNTLFFKQISVSVAEQISHLPGSLQVFPQS